MDIQWSMIWTRSNAVAAKSNRPDAFADPLERDEWRGLQWSIPLVARLLTGNRRAALSRRKIKEVERFTGTTPTQAVCVS
jgi:hypothetical protein